MDGSARLFHLLDGFCRLHSIPEEVMQKTQEFQVQTGGFDGVYLWEMSVASEWSSEIPAVGDFCAEGCLFTFCSGGIAGVFAGCDDFDDSGDCIIGFVLMYEVRDGDKQVCELF